MSKKIVTVMLALLMMFTVAGCSPDKNKRVNKKNKENIGITIKSVKDFKESEGLVKYFTIDDKKFSIPETVGELVNYLEQIGDVTLSETGNKVEDIEIEAGSISSMVAYLNVELKDGTEGRVWIRYENNTDKTITVAEAKMTYLELKYDEYSETEYEKVFDNITIVTQNETFKMNDKRGFKHVVNAMPDAVKNIDGRLEYDDALGFKYIFDCCNENRTGVFRGFIIKYPTE